MPHLLPLSALLPSPLRASLSPCPLPLSLDHTLTLVDRDLYPEDKSPYGQWSYMRFYEDHFDEATASFDKNPRNFVKALFRKGSPGAVGKPSGTSVTYAMGGWFGGAGKGPPDVPRDTDVLTQADMEAYASALERNSFRGPDAFYMNHAANAAYALTAPDGGQLHMPALFVAAAYDTTCVPSMGQEMGAHCDRPSYATIDCGQWEPRSVLRW